MSVITDFSATQVKNASIQFFNDGVQEEGTIFGCMGTLEAETEVREKTKNCEGKLETITIPIYMTVTVGAHIKVSVLRNVFGVNTDGLKAGVHKYGINSKPKKFVYTADEIDEFGDIVKLIAFANCSALSGLSISVDNDADEVAYIEFEFRANADDKGEFYYDAFIEELTDPTIALNWHKTFTRTLIEEPEV